MVSHVDGSGKYNIVDSGSPQEEEPLNPEDQKASSVANDALKFNIDDELRQVAIRKGISDCLLQPQKENIDREKIKGLIAHLKDPSCRVEYYLKCDYPKTTRGSLIWVATFYLKDPEILDLLLKKEGARLNEKRYLGCASGTLLDLVEKQLPNHPQMAEVIREHGGENGNYSRVSCCSVQ